MSSNTTAGPCVVTLPPNPKISQLVYTCFKSNPLSGEIGVVSWKPSSRGVDPVANTIRSGLISSTRSGSTREFKVTFTSRRSISVSSHLVIAPISALWGALAAIAT